jgi:hypothetical protein
MFPIDYSKIHGYTNTQKLTFKFKTHEEATRFAKPYEYAIVRPCTKIGWQVVVIRK